MREWLCGIGSMATEADHISLANSNQLLIDHLIEVNDFPDWLTTVSFYKAVHVVEAVFANDLHYHSSSHTNREDRMKRTAKFESIFKNYSHLLTESRTFRYALPPRQRWTVELVKSRLIYKKLYAVEQQSLQFLSQQAAEELSKVQPPPKP